MMKIKLIASLSIILLLASCKQILRQAVEEGMEKVEEVASEDPPKPETESEALVNQVPNIDFYKKAEDPKALYAMIDKEIEAGKIPIVYFTATWCRPCRDFKKALPEANMQKAFKNAVIIEIDVDKDDEGYAPLLGVKAIPAFVKLGKDGLLLNKIDGGAWGQNNAENMAPVLEDFIQATES